MTVRTFMNKDRMLASLWVVCYALFHSLFGLLPHLAHLSFLTVSPAVHLHLHLTIPLSLEPPCFLSIINSPSPCPTPPSPSFYLPFLPDTVLFSSPPSPSSRTLSSLPLLSLSLPSWLEGTPLSTLLACRQQMTATYQTD